MKITLQDLRIENFKGIKFFGIEPEGQNATIIAENGIGKTTIYDAFLWLLFGKNSEGVSQFGIVPCDADNKAIRNIVVCVEAILDIDGKKVPLKREKHEKVVKKQLKGYTDHYWVNDVPKKESEYTAYIKEHLISEDIFKMLTDLTQFNAKMHWKERRAVLMELAGVVKVKGFEKLLELVGEDRTIDEYKKILTDRKKGYDEERKTIGPRIDENQKGLDEYATEGKTAGLETRRAEFSKAIADFDKQRTELLANENERQEKTKAINALKLLLSQREHVLRSDNTAVQSLLDEKAEWEVKVHKASTEVTRLESVGKGMKIGLETAKNNLENKTADLQNVRDAHTAASEKPIDDKCYACKQTVPDDMKDRLEQGRTESIITLENRGKTLFAAVKVCKQEIEHIEIEIAEATETHTAAFKDFEILAEAKAERFAEIDVKIANKPTPLPERDKDWVALNTEIFNLEKKIGKPAADRLTEIETQRNALSVQLETLNKTLANADTIKKSGERIAELGEREKELSQKIADVEALISEIDTYKKTESGMVEEAVNGKFEHTIFKLFDYRLNGEINETCIATYKGIDYGDLSFGQRIYVGIDIVNVLSEHYEISCPLFLDHLEALTMPVEAKTQVIGLFAEKGVKELTVEIEKPDSECMDANLDADMIDSLNEIVEKHKAPEKAETE